MLLSKQWNSAGVPFTTGMPSWKLSCHVKHGSSPSLTLTNGHLSPPDSLKQTSGVLLICPPSSPKPSMDFPKFLLVGLLLSLLTASSYSATSRDHRDFFKSCSSHQCSKHGPEIRFPFRLSTQPPSCGAPGMQLSCSGHDTILDHLVLGASKVTAIYYRYGVMNVIPLADSSSHCPLQKLITTNQSTDVYIPITIEDSVLVGCPTDFVSANPDRIVGASSCLSLTNNASQFWYLVHPGTDMSTLPKGCEVVANCVPIPYTYDKNGRRYYTPFFGRSLFKEKAEKKIKLGETSFNWSFNNITRVCQRCEQEGKHCAFDSTMGKHSASIMVPMLSSLQLQPR